MPCGWAEIERGEVGPRSFTLRNVPARVAEQGDAWVELHARPFSLAPALERLAGELSVEELRAARAASVRKPRARKPPPS
jgi:hypothetical protein